MNGPVFKMLLLEQHEALYEAIMEGRAQEAGVTARRHIDYVEQTIKRTQQAGNWEEISRMRLTQLSDRESKPPNRMARPAPSTGEGSTKSATDTDFDILQTDEQTSDQEA